MLSHLKICCALGQKNWNRQVSKVGKKSFRSSVKSRKKVLQLKCQKSEKSRWRRKIDQFWPKKLSKQPSVKSRKKVSHKYEWGKILEIEPLKWL